MVDRYLARASAALLFLVAAVGAGNAQAQNYEGPGLLRFGVFAQGTFVDLDVRAMPFGTATFFDAGTAGLDGIGGGVSFGYDWRISPGFVLGIDGDLSLDSASEPFAGHDYGIDYLLTVRGRLGAYVHPSWMIYVTGGYAALGVEYKGEDTGVGGVPNKIDSSLSGWTVGVGTEIDRANWILFAEYLYADFGTWDFTNATGDRYSIDVTGHFVRAGVKFKIGHDYRDTVLPTLK